MKRCSEPLKVKVTVGLWWRWQDLNLRPWDYDSPAQPRIKQKSSTFSKGTNTRDKHLGQTSQW